MKHTKLSRVKETLKSILAQFSEERVTSDKGILSIAKAGEEIAVGDTVLAVNEEGLESQVENGDYLLTDGTVLRIADGKIAEIVVPEKEAPAQEEPEAKEEEKPEEPAEEPKAEEEKPAEEEEKPAEENPVVEEPKEEEKEEEKEEPSEEPKAEEPEVENPTNEGEESETDAVVALRKEVNELYELVHRLEADVERLKSEPAAKPATEEFARVNKIGRTGDEKLDRLAKLMGA